MPVISDGPYGYEHVNVAKQRRDPDSMFNWTERIIRMRKEVPEIGWGDFAVLDTGNPAVLAMRYDWRNNSVLTLHNFNAQPLEVQFKPGVGDRGDLLVNLLTDDHSRADARSRHCVSWRGTATVGTASAGWTTCSCAPKSTLAQRSERPGDRSRRTAGGKVVPAPGIEGAFSQRESSGLRDL